MLLSSSHFPLLCVLYSCRPSPFTLYYSSFCIYPFSLFYTLYCAAQVKCRSHLYIKDAKPPGSTTFMWWNLLIILSKLWSQGWILTLHIIDLLLPQSSFDSFTYWVDEQQPSAQKAFSTFTLDRTVEFVRVKRHNACPCDSDSSDCSGCQGWMFLLPFDVIYNDSSLIDAERCKKFFFFTVHHISGLFFFFFSKTCLAWFFLSTLISWTTGWIMLKFLETNHKCTPQLWKPYPSILGCLSFFRTWRQKVQEKYPDILFPSKKKKASCGGFSGISTPERIFTVFAGL